MASRWSEWMLTERATLCHGPSESITPTRCLVLKHRRFRRTQGHPRMPSQKRKEGTQPGKLPDYFMLQRRYTDQNGSGGIQREHTSGSHTLSSAASAMNTGRSIHKPGKGNFSSPTSDTSSPIKSKQKLNCPEGEDLEVSLDSSVDDTRELQDSITDFPTANTPVMDTTLKDMLVSLRSTLHANILALTQQFKSEISTVNKSIAFGNKNG